jgi:oxygen-dependent protoporphyrinogen oxidase
MNAVASARFVVVGGGIAGLAAAHAATVRAREVGLRVSVTVLERSPRFGGPLVTDEVDGFVLDAGPDSWVATKPHAAALARDLGLGEDLIGTNEATRRYYVAYAGRLHPVPEGLVLGVPTRLLPLAASRLFSWPGKIRMAFEPFVRARRFDGDDDESIADFASRRLGREAADRLVAPLLGGISAGDASELSARAAIPQLVALERDHGSLVVGMRAAQKARVAAAAASGRGGAGTERGAERTDDGSGGAGRGERRKAVSSSGFLSLRGGIGTLPRALCAELARQGVTLRPGTPAHALARTDTGFALEIGAGERVEADALVLAVPGHAASSLLGGIDGVVANTLDQIEYGSTATVFLAYRCAEVSHPLDGVGFVVPRSLGMPILASTWVSSKWVGRAPAGHALIRAFFGGAQGHDVLRRDDGALADLAQRELRTLMGIDVRPLWSRVYRFERATAQMRVGHLARMREVRERLARAAPAIRIAGGGYDGVGIPDCIRQGQDAAHALVEELRSSRS